MQDGEKRTTILAAKVFSPSGSCHSSRCSAAKARPPSYRCPSAVLGSSRTFLFRLLFRPRAQAPGLLLAPAPGESDPSLRQVSTVAAPSPPFPRGGKPARPRASEGQQRRHPPFGLLEARKNVAKKKKERLRGRMSEGRKARGTKENDHYPGSEGPEQRCRAYGDAQGGREEGRGWGR